jgi:hypothetical protein
VSLPIQSAFQFNSFEHRRRSTLARHNNAWQPKITQARIGMRMSYPTILQANSESEPSPSAQGVAVLVPPKPI